MKENDAKPFRNLTLEETDFLRIRKQYHFDSSHQEQLQKVYEELKKVMTPSANLTVIDKESNERLSFVNESEYVIGTITLGKGIDELFNHYIQNNYLFESYALDCLCMALLGKSYEQFESLVYEKCGQWPEHYEFIGDNYPLETISELLRFVPQARITHNEAFALIPSKSVVFLATLSKERTGCALRICDNCGNKNCVNKKRALSYGEMQIFRKGNMV